MLHNIAFNKFLPYNKKAKSNTYNQLQNHDTW